jgi:HK97 family phage major capsid protein
MFKENTMSRINELRTKRHERVTALEDISASAEKEKRNFTAEESKKWNEHFDEAEKLKHQIECEEKREALSREMASKASKDPENRSDNKDDVETRAAKQLEGFRKWIASGRIAGEDSQEFRALQGDIDAQGGFLVAPEQFVTDLIKEVDDIVSIRKLATVFSVPNADSLGAPSLDNDPADADWTAEIKTGSEDGAMSFGKRSLKPHPVAKRIKASNTLIRKSVLPVERIIRQRMGYKFAVTEEKAFLTGNGANQPLGLFTASANGISTGRDISTGNSTTAITWNGLMEAMYGVKDQYRNNGTWLFHRDGLKQIAKILDANNLPIFNLRDGEINGRPYISSEYVPSTFTASSYVGMFGDFKNYWIADALDMRLQRLDELYAETNQTGFIGRKETDGMPVLEEAFARVQLAAS